MRCSTDCNCRRTGGRQLTGGRSSAASSVEHVTDGRNDWAHSSPDKSSSPEPTANFVHGSISGRARGDVSSVGGFAAAGQAGVA